MIQTYIIAFYILLLLFTLIAGLRYMFWRLLGLIPLLFIIATLAFFLIRSVKGGPFDEERKIPEESKKTNGTTVQFG